MGRPPLPPIFWLQLSLLTAFAPSHWGNRFFRSNVRVAGTGRSRTTDALRAGAGKIPSAYSPTLAPPGEVGLYLTVPRLEKVRGANLGVAEAATVLGTIEPAEFAR